MPKCDAVFEGGSSSSLKTSRITGWLRMILRSPGRLG